MPSPTRPVAITLTLLCAILGCGTPAPPPPGAGEGTEAELVSFFPPPEARLLLLGTFHFKDAGLDDYKPQHDIDILSDGRQREVMEVIESLAAWQPTRIAVEMDLDRQTTLDERYSSYLAGEFELGSNEVYQIAYRLGERLGHERIWAIDAEARWFEPWVDPDEWAKANGQTELLDPRWDEAYAAWYASEDEAKTRRTLREHLLHMNREDALMRLHGHYVLPSLGIGDGVEYPGADSRTGWYNRNLRIFGNVLRLAERPDERIFVLIGAGHVPILRHAAQASPAVELVEVAEVL